MIKSDNRNSPDKRGSKSRREYLYKELSDINSMPINERKSSNTSSVIEPREIENTIIMQSPQDEDYINSAIDRIALIMSRHIVEDRIEDPSKRSAIVF